MAMMYNAVRTLYLRVTVARLSLRRMRHGNDFMFDLLTST